MTAAEIASDCIVTLLNERMFSSAVVCLTKYRASLDDEGIWRLLLAVCGSYDLYQYNRSDESLLQRKDFVVALAQFIESTGSLGFVHPTTAIALAFHPTTRLVFSQMACKSPSSVVDYVFSRDRAVDEHAYIAKTDGHLRFLNLRDVYWGRGCEQHIALFLQHRMAPYFSHWHTSEELSANFNSLDIGVPILSVISLMAQTIRAGLFRPSNVQMCGKALDEDPLCGKNSPMADLILVGRTLSFNSGPRVCNHFRFAEVVSGARNGAESRLIIEIAICGLATLDVPDLVIYELVRHLVPVEPARWEIMRNIERVRAKSRYLLGEKTKRIKND